MNSVLKISDLYVSVGETPILNGVDMEIRQGEIHALMGPNGSGKARWPTHWPVTRTTT